MELRLFECGPENPFQRQGVFFQKWSPRFIVKQNAEGHFTLSHNPFGGR
mgnify:CR=1 FL=1